MRPQFPSAKPQTASIIIITIIRVKIKLKITKSGAARHFMLRWDKRMFY